MFSKEITAKAQQVLKTFRQQGLKLATAESCTAGLIIAALTEIPGSSAVVDRGIVSYSNEAKIELLTVPTFFIDDYGAVSRETALAMAEGMLLNSRADIAVSVTGIAGPDGGTETKPVGLVYFGLAAKGKPTHSERHIFKGSRSNIRQHAVLTALGVMLKAAYNH